MKQLIVNADDFGMAASINTGILEAHRSGIVTSTTLMANGAAFVDAVTLAKSAPELGVGVHLNLTQGASISAPNTVASLVDKNNKMFRQPAVLWGDIALGRLDLSEVERELSSQIEFVRDAGIAITHLDGHKHIHMLPAIHRIILRLASKYGIPAVRTAVEYPLELAPLLRQNRQNAPRIFMQYIQSRTLARLAVGSSARLKQAGVQTPAFFFGITQTGFLKAEELSMILKSIPEGTSELMCHPGQSDPTLERDLTRLREERQRELDALASPEIIQLISQLGIQLCSYRGLGAA